MAVFRNKTFTRERVVLDDSEFYNCFFDHCELIYSGGMLSLDFKTLNCTYRFEGSASRTLRFWRYLKILPTGELTEIPEHLDSSETN